MNVALAWTVTDSPVGAVTLVSSERGLVRVAFETENVGRILAQVQEAFNADLVQVDTRNFITDPSQSETRTFPADDPHASSILGETGADSQSVPVPEGTDAENAPQAWSILGRTVCQVGQYFAGRRQVFDVALDRSLLGGFRLAANQAISRIPYGQVRSYGDVADMAGFPRAARAAGTACRMNPLPIVVPCHRVIKADGSIGGYGPGLDIKRFLLGLERSIDYVHSCH